MTTERERNKIAAPPLAATPAATVSRVDAILTRLKNVPVIAYGVVVAIGIVGIGKVVTTVTDVYKATHPAADRLKDTTPPPAIPQLSAEELADRADLARNPNYRVDLIKLANQGCYFFYGDGLEISHGPASVGEAQSAYIASLTEGDAKLVVKGYWEGGKTREFAIAAAARRAAAVKEYLVKQFHIRSDSIDTISYGEEQPGAPVVEEYVCGAVVENAENTGP
ncbi:MAG TPA: OmpA family protein [Rhizomicrobium sp.]|jgi:outer membrane protein OmpA-like peptidoglycan-associated protein